MCYFSAEAVAVRKAKAKRGERLITAFVTSHAVGFVEPTPDGDVVCMMPGTHVLAEVPIVVQRAYGLNPIAPATFEQLHDHDGLQFHAGPFIFLKALGYGFEVTIEFVPVEKETAAQLQMRNEQRSQTQPVRQGEPAVA